MWTRGVTDDNEKVAVGLGDALLNMMLAEESNGPSAGFRVLFSLEFWLGHTVKEIVPETTWPLVQVLNHFCVVFLGTVVLAERIGDWSKYHEYCHNCVESIAGVLSKDVHVKQKPAR